MTVRAYLQAPSLIGPLGPEAACQARFFQGIPSVEVSDSGRLWSAWYGGGRGEDRDNRVMVATSAGAEQPWSPVRYVIDPGAAGPVRAFDPCLWHDTLGRLWLFWAQGYEAHTDARAGVWAARTEDSHLEEPSWSEPRRICDGIMMNKPTVLSSGEWLLPVAEWGREGSARVYSSTDEGETWTLLGMANVPRREDRSCDEHMVVELGDGRLWMWVRTSYGIGESTSNDRGATWSPVEPSRIPHPASRFFLRRLSSGRILLIKNGSMRGQSGRSHLTAYLSRDDGQSWDGGLLLDERDDVSYPDGAQATDGAMYVVYDRDRTGAGEILMATFTEADVLDRISGSSVSALRVVVNAIDRRDPKSHR